LRKGDQVIAIAPDFPPDIEKWCSTLAVVMERVTIANQSLNPLRDVVSIFSLYRIIRRHRPDVVMGYTHKPALYTAFAAKAARVPKITMMVTGMGFGFEPGDGWFRRTIPVITHTLFFVACEVCQTIIFHNKDNRDYFLSRRMLRKASKAIVVGGSGVDLKHFTPQPLNPCASTDLTFLQIARIVRYKGVLEYAHAARSLKDNYPRARFLLVGYWDDNPLSYSAEEWAFIQANLEYLGSSTDVRELYQQAHVYVLPSYGEGMPRTVLEAMASARPIITTDTYGCRDTVAEGVNGHLVPIKDWRSLAGAMEHFLSGRSPAAKMGAMSLERARDLFDVESVNGEMIKALGL
jgi:glycosyltransferase involved in cell wall biosynthesis